MDFLSFAKKSMSALQNLNLSLTIIFMFISAFPLNSPMSHSRAKNVKFTHNSIPKLGIWNSYRMIVVQNQIFWWTSFDDKCGHKFQLFVAVTALTKLFLSGTVQITYLLILCAISLNHSPVELDKSHFSKRYNPSTQAAFQVESY